MSARWGRLGMFLPGFLLASLTYSVTRVASQPGIFERLRYESEGSEMTLRLRSPNEGFLVLFMEETPSSGTSEVVNLHIARGETTFTASATQSAVVYEVRPVARTQWSDSGLRWGPCIPSGDDNACPPVPFLPVPDKFSYGPNPPILLMP